MADALTRASASRATRSSRDLRLLVLLALACVAGITVLRAQETPPADAETAPVTEPDGTEAAGEDEKIDFPDAPDPNATPSKPPAAPPSEGPTTEAPAEAADEEVDGEEPPPEATPRTPGVVGDTPVHFEPTEKVRADFDVSFPVDI
jgi:hypothetical protein